MSQVESGEPAINGQASIDGFPFPRSEDALANMAGYLIDAQRDNLTIRFEGTSQRDLRLLFGDLAMHFAGIDPSELAADTPAWSRGVMEAFRRFTTQPELFEKVTNAPYAEEFMKGIMPIPEATGDQYSEEELTQAREIQKAVSEKGYLSHAMLPANKLIRLDYVASVVHGKLREKRRRFRSDEAPEDIISLKLVPYSNKHRVWVVKQYGRFDGVNGFSQPLGKERKVYQNECFNLVAVDSTQQADKTLAGVAQREDGIQIGHITIGSQLKVDYDFKRMTKEVPGHENNQFTSQSIALPYVLRQAYYGDTFDFPLFK